MLAHLFKDYVQELALPLMLIWRRCLDAGKMPEEEKIYACVTLLHKGGDKSDPTNYRLSPSLFHNLRYLNES